MTVSLSLREQTCLSWAAQGKSSWDIGEILAISENTVNFHIKNAMRKLETTSRTVAAIKAVQLGIIRSPARPEPDEPRSSLHPASAEHERHLSTDRDCGEAVDHSLRHPGRSSGFDRFRVRVLPFLAPQSRRHEAVAFSLSQEIAVGIARFGWLDVTAPVLLKCRRYAHTDGQAATQRRIDYVIDGALSSDGHELQVRVRLLDLPADARQLWSVRVNVAINRPPVRLVARPDPMFSNDNEQERPQHAPELLHAAVKSILSRHRPGGMARQIAS